MGVGGVPGRFGDNNIFMFVSMFPKHGILRCRSKCRGISARELDTHYRWALFKGTPLYESFFIRIWYIPFKNPNVFKNICTSGSI